ELVGGLEGVVCREDLAVFVAKPAVKEGLKALPLALTLGHLRRLADFDDGCGGLAEHINVGALPLAASLDGSEDLVGPAARVLFALRAGLRRRHAGKVIGKLAAKPRPKNGDDHVAVRGLGDLLLKRFVGAVEFRFPTDGLKAGKLRELAV